MSENTYTHLERRLGANCESLFIKDRQIRAEVLYRETISEKPRTAEEVARDYQVPLEAVQEAIHHCVHNQEFLRQEWVLDDTKQRESEKDHPRQIELPGYDHPIWREYRKRPSTSTLFILVTPLLAVGGMLVLSGITPYWPIFTGLVIFPILFFTQVRWRFYPCPRCGRALHYRSSFIPSPTAFMWVFTGKCVNCGLPIYAFPEDMPTQERLRRIQKSLLSEANDDMANKPAKNREGE